MYTFTGTFGLHVVFRHLEGGQLSLVRTLVDIDGQCEVEDREVLYM